MRRRSIRWTWTKRRQCTPLRALNLILRIIFQSPLPGQWSLWLGTGLFAVDLWWKYPDYQAEVGLVLAATTPVQQKTGAQIWILPRLNRRESENMYACNLDLRFSHAAPVAHEGML